jgi:uncharacterized protein with ATP-grasp and redox domains
MKEEIRKILQDKANYYYTTKGVRVMYEELVIEKLYELLNEKQPYKNLKK